MPDGLALAWLMLPLGVALGWYLARRWPQPQEHADSGSPEYLTGLAHLANQDPDQAITAFVKALEVDDETVELHLTLGSLFRKRGEVDRALRIHENLLARPNLKPVFQNQARFELAQDFYKAGVIDRAETLFRELVAQGMFLEASLEHLMLLSEQSRDWRQAIETARQLQAVKSISLREVIAQYYCERAEEAQARKDSSEALRLTGRALSENADCVRASLLQGAMHEASGDHAAALKAYRRVPDQDARYVSEALAPLRRCHESLRDLAGFGRFLEEAEAFWTHPAIVVARAQLMRQSGDDPISYLVERLQQQPDWRGLDLLLEIISEQYGETAPILQGLRRVLQQVLKRRTPYRCLQCGFTPGLLLWQCPSCRQWGSVVPFNELESPKTS
jgi:lipopolysaccharide assembly protein B